MKRKITKYILLLVIAFFSNTKDENSALASPKPKSIFIVNNNIVTYQISSSSQNEAFIVERLAYTTSINEFIVTNKIVKSYSNSIVFREHHTTGYYNQYSFKVSNLLIRYRRKALIFPFQYFW